MKDIAVIINARKNSQRCQNKLLRSFHDTTILDIALSKLNNIQNFTCYLASGEEEITSKILNYRNIKHISRTHDELNSDFPLSKIFAYHKNIKHEWIMFLNPCLVFLKKETIESALNQFSLNNYKSLTSVKRNHNWFYTPDGYPINNKNPKEISTKTSPWIYEVCHAFHIYKREHLINENSYWNHSDNCDPYLFEIDQFESIDIDTEVDFLMSENIYKSYV